LQGTQTQLDFVPEKHTDFIFALWAEETGFFGSMILILLFLALVWCLSLLALQAKTVFARLLIAGVATSLFLHVFVNISMVVGLAPVVGVPLPLISYGGTSLFSLLIGLGLSLGIAGRIEDVKRPTTLSRGERPALR
jgi:rod shape determining protein RodA